MSDLRLGSTVGGFLIITEKTSNLHTHLSDQISGHGSAALLDDGPDSDLAVDKIDGINFDTMDSVFVNRTGDSVSGDINLLKEPIDNDSGINRKILERFTSEQNFIRSNISPIVVVGDELSFDSSNSTLEVSSVDIFIQGDIYTFSSQNIDISEELSSDTGEGFVYFFYDESNEAVDIGIENEFSGYNDNRFYVAKINTDGSFNIESIEEYRGQFWIDGYLVSEQSNSDITGLKQIPKSREDGLIDNSWFNHNPSATIPVSLEGPTIISSNTTNEYVINDFDSFSNYELEVDHGTIFINNNDMGSSTTLNRSEFSIEFDDLTQVENEVVHLIIRRNDFEVKFDLRISDNSVYNGNIEEVLDVSDDLENFLDGIININIIDGVMYYTTIETLIYGYSVWKYDLRSQEKTQIVTGIIGDDLSLINSLSVTSGKYIYFMGGATTDADMDQYDGESFIDAVVNEEEEVSTLSRVLKFDTETEEFTEVAGLPVSLTNFVLGIDQAEKNIYVAFGATGEGNIAVIDPVDFDPNYKIFKYNIYKDKWSEVGDFEDTDISNGYIGELNTGNRECVIIHGKIIFSNLFPDSDNIEDHFWEFNLLNKKWKKIYPDTENGSIDISEGSSRLIRVDDSIYRFGTSTSDQVFAEFRPRNNHLIEITDFSNLLNQNTSVIALNKDDNSFYVFNTGTVKFWRIT